nr:hypothetical protein [Gemmatimonadaceae bacterium]
LVFWEHDASGSTHKDLPDVPIADNDAGAGLRDLRDPGKPVMSLVTFEIDEKNRELPARFWPEITPATRGSAKGRTVLQPPGSGPWFSCFNGCCTTDNVN